jgi:putative integral membrane protein (TIGR02587 family)
VNEVQDQAAARNRPGSEQPPDGSIPRSLQEYGRGIAGGLLFSLPLLYTMEMWWFGFIIEPDRLIVYVVVTFVLLLAYNRFAGLHEDATWAEVAIDSVEEMGIGLVLSIAILTILGRVTLDMPASEVLGKTVIEGMTAAIGVSVGTAQLGGGNGNQQDTTPNPEMDPRPGTFHQQLVIAFIGAVLVGGNIAPTEEILMLGVEVSHWNLAALIALSLSVNAVILFYSDFAGSARHIPEDITHRWIFGKTLASYVVALFAAAMILWFFGRFEGVSLMTALSQTIVLGLVTTFGASAGRLLLQ